MPRASIPFVLLLLAAALPAQQTLPPEVEARLRALEAKAARVDSLEARVADLQGRLEEYQEEEANKALEESINALLLQDKPINVSARKATWLTIGGQLRLRTEYRTVSIYQEGRSTGDEDFTIQRTRINFDARLAEDIRVFAEIQDSRVWGEEENFNTTPGIQDSVMTNIRGVDLHQGYIDFERIFGSDLTLRAGRFELSIWNQRLISPLDWDIVGRAWDGIAIVGDIAEDWNLVAGYSTLAEPATIDSDKDTDLYLAFLTYTGWEDNTVGVGFAAVHSDTRPNDFNLYTVTLHWDGKAGGFDYSLDLVGQWGDTKPGGPPAAELDIEAYAIAAEVGYTFDVDWKPRISIEWTWASGDDDPTDGEVNTFNPLFPFGHTYWGYMDIWSWQNGHDLVLHLQAKPDEDWWLEVAFHSFWLDSSKDSWFNAGGAPIRTDPTGNAGEHVGLELDISVKYWFTKDVFLWFGYSHFFAGDYVSDTGDDDDSDWIWCQLTATF